MGLQRLAAQFFILLLIAVQQRTRVNFARPEVLFLLRQSNLLNTDCSVIVISDSLLEVLTRSSGM